MDWREGFETVDGCRTRLMRGGAGAPLLFLHGARGAGAWLPFMTRLAERHEIIVPEHPGFGGSDTPAWLDRIGDLAYFYLDLLARLGLSRVDLVGTSLGGWIAAELAIRDCSRLRSLVLSAPAGIHVKGVRKGDLFLWGPEEGVRNLYHDQSLADRALAEPPSDEQRMVLAKNRLMVAKLAWQPRLYDPDLHKWLHRISAPTLLIWGDDDKLIPPPYGPAFAALIPGARLEIMTDCGHLPHVERPDEFAARVTGFIEGVAP